MSKSTNRHPAETYQLRDTRRLRIPDQKRQRFRSEPATISDPNPPPIPTEACHQDGPLGVGAGIGC